MAAAKDGPGALESEIEETRERLSLTLDELQLRLQPKFQMERIMTSLRDKTSSVLESTGEQSRRLAGSSRTFALDHPALIAGLVGTAGFYAAYRWLQSAARPMRTVVDAHGYPTTAMESGDSGLSVRQVYHDVKSGVGDTLSKSAGAMRSLIDSTRERTATATSTAMEKTRRGTSYVRDKAVDGYAASTRALDEATMENPMLAFGAAVVVGAALAALLPRTSRENALMGRASDRMTEAARRAARAARAAATDQAQKSGLTGKVQDGPLAEIGDAVSRAAKAAGDAAVQTVKGGGNGAQTQPVTH